MHIKGLNNVNFLKDSFELEVDTLYGKPSDKLICGKLGNNVDCVLLSRHDKNHLTGPSQVNYRANLLALKSNLFYSIFHLYYFNLV